MIKTTKAQRLALWKVFQRDFPGWLTPTSRSERKPCPHCGYSGEVVRVPSLQWRAFRKTVQPGPDCIMLPWKGMWLGIERDGYTHS